MQRILAAYDGSEASKHAVARAAEFAERLGSSLTVLVVGELLETGYGTVAPVVEEEVFQNLAAEGVALARQRGVAASGDVAWGGPASCIEAAAREGSFDLIVVGHRGHGGIHELFLGSVAKHVIDHAPCSVLVVR